MIFQMLTAENCKWRIIMQKEYMERNIPWDIRYKISHLFANISEQKEKENLHLIPQQTRSENNCRNSGSRKRRSSHQQLPPGHFHQKTQQRRILQTAL